MQAEPDADLPEGLAPRALLYSSLRATAPSTSRTATKGGWNPDTWQPPVVDSTPDDPYEAAVYRGLAILTHTRDSLPHYVNANLNCTSCHLNGGTTAYASPWVGIWGVFPEYRSRNAKVNALQDRINDCFERSLNGKRIQVSPTPNLASALLCTGFPYDVRERGEFARHFEDLRRCTVVIELAPGPGPLGDAAPVKPDPSWLEYRRLKTALGEHLLARTDQGWRQFDPVSLQPRDPPSAEQLEALVADALPPDRAQAVFRVGR